MKCGLVKIDSGDRRVLGSSGEAIAYCGCFYRAQIGQQETSYTRPKHLRYLFLEQVHMLV